MLKALIFDVDGTLADTERQGHRVAFNEAFRAAGLTWCWDERLYAELLRIPGGKERIRHFVEVYRPRVPVAERELPEFIAALHRDKTHAYNALIERGSVPPRPGALRLLQEARGAGLRLAIATTTAPENVHALLAHSFAPGAADWFDAIAAGDMVRRKKPAPDIYRYALERMNLRAADCLAVEDSANGLRASTSAGLPTIVAVSDDTRDESFEGALLITDHLGEPDVPCRVLGGGFPVASPTVVDVALLRVLHRHAAHLAA